MPTLAILMLVGLAVWPTATAAAVNCPTSTFAGARALHGRLTARLADAGATVSERAEAAGDYDRVVAGILGIDPRDDHQTVRAFIEAIGDTPPALVACDAAMLARDRLAYRLASVGYSTAAIGRIVRGEASRAGIDAAHARRMAGYSEPAPMASTPRTFAAVLPPVRVVGPPVARAERDADVIGRVVAPALPGPAPRRRDRTVASAVRRAAPTPDQLDAHIRHYARSYQVDHALVYAIIRQESNWSTASVSPKGARGLMQLMPATARMLGVDPDDPLDNVRGGIAFLADLLQAYGNTRDALIAYNAGPAHANQVRRGERGLFDETRRYLEAIGRSYPID